jgi:hypothetical protein
MVYSTNLDAARRACDRRMVTFAHTAPDCAEIMWNEANWTLVSMPITSTRAQWDEGLRSVRQFNDLLRVLPPTPRRQQSETAAGSAKPATRRNGQPSRPLGSGGAVQAPEDSAVDQAASSSRAASPSSGNAASAAEPAPRRRTARDESSGMLHVPAAGRNGRQTAHYQR